MTTPNWSSLPPDLILTISQSLTLISDYLHLRSLCSSFRSALPPNPTHLPPQPPILLRPLPSPSPLYSPLPLPKSSPPLSSSHGLLLLLLLSPTHPPTLLLTNPLTRSPTLTLPPLPLFPNSPFFLKKLSLSPSPHPQTLALLSRSPHLALCRHRRSSSWSFPSPQSSSSFHDALFFNHHFHLVDAFRRISRLNEDTLTLTELARVRTPRSPPFIGRGEKCYLVEHNAALLLVVRLFKNAVTSGFEVFRMGVGEEWGGYEEVRSLGDFVVFIGLSGSIARGAGECPGFRKGCIYFLDDALNCNGDVAQRVGDSGVFETSDGGVEVLRECVGEDGLVYDRRPSVWFTPSLCS